MIEAGERARLAIEAFQPLGIGGGVFRKKLQGNLAPQPGVTRAVHLSHAAGPDGGDDLVAPRRVPIESAMRRWLRRSVDSSGRRRTGKENRNSRAGGMDDVLRPLLHWLTDDETQRGSSRVMCRCLLGHPSITTTERYDNQKLENLQAAARLERGETFDPGPRESAIPSSVKFVSRVDEDAA